MKNKGILKIYKVVYVGKSTTQICYATR